MSTFTLYRFFNAENVLLYVGLTVNPGRRMEKHRATQPWWNDVARIEMEQHPDLATLRAAEREAIEHEQPRHNVRMNGVRPQSEVCLTWFCEECGEPIADEDGYITVSEADLGEYAREPDRLRYSRPRVRWHVLHQRCDPYPDYVTTDRWIGVERVRTHADLLRLTAHLFGKRWVHYTNWAAVIRDLASQEPYS